MALPTAQWRSLVDTVVAGTVLPSNLFEAMVFVESNGDPNARSASDARGLCQLIPRWHADGVGKKVAQFLGKPLTDDLWFDPEFSLRCGARHLTWCYDSDGSRGWVRAVRKYFTGTADPPDGFKDGQGTTVEQHIGKIKEALEEVDKDRRDAILKETTARGGEGGEIPGPGPEEPAPLPAGAHVYIFSMGHRNTGDGNGVRGGAPGESDWTPSCVSLVAEEFRARGATVIIAQEEDDDDDGQDCQGMSRLAVAKLSAELARNHNAGAYLSFHYNGSGGQGNMPGFHAVVPDGVGSSGNDTMENNPKDVRLAKSIAQHLKEANTVSIYRDGVFSEFHTNAVKKERGARLDEMRGTATERDRSVRLILEAADYSTSREREYLQDEQWVRNVYAVAVADGCEDVFGPFPKRGRDAGGFAAPLPVEGLTEFVANGKLVKEPPPELTVPSGETMIFINKTARANRDTPRRQSGSQDAPSVGPDVQAGQTFNVAWKYEATDGNSYFLTPFWTRIDADDVEVTG